MPLLHDFSRLFRHLPRCPGEQITQETLTRAFYPWHCISRGEILLLLRGCSQEFPVELSFPHWIKFLVLLTQNSAFPGSSLSLLPPPKKPSGCGIQHIQTFPGSVLAIFPSGIFPPGCAAPWGSTGHRLPSLQVSQGEQDPSPIPAGLTPSTGEVECLEMFSTQALKKGGRQLSRAEWGCYCFLGAVFKIKM